MQSHALLGILLFVRVEGPFDATVAQLEGRFESGCGGPVFAVCAFIHGSRILIHPFGNGEHVDMAAVSGGYEKGLLTHGLREGAEPKQALNAKNFVYSK